MERAFARILCSHCLVAMLSRIAGGPEVLTDSTPVLMHPTEGLRAGLALQRPPATLVTTLCSQPARRFTSLLSKTMTSVIARVAALSIR